MQIPKYTKQPHKIYIKWKLNDKRFYLQQLHFQMMGLNVTYAKQTSPLHAHTYRYKHTKTEHTHTHTQSNTLTTPNSERRQKLTVVLAQRVKRELSQPALSFTSHMQAMYYIDELTEPVGLWKERGLKASRLVMHVHSALLNKNWDIQCLSQSLSRGYSAMDPSIKCA